MQGRKGENQARMWSQAMRRPDHSRKLWAWPVQRPLWTKGPAFYVSRTALPTGSPDLQRTATAELPSGAGGPGTAASSLPW